MLLFRFDGFGDLAEFDRQPITVVGWASAKDLYADCRTLVEFSDGTRLPVSDREIVQATAKS